MATLDELGSAIQTRRSEMGLTQARVAALSGLTRQTVNQLEKGTIGDLSLKRASRLAEVLGLSLQVQDPHAGGKSVPSGKLSALERAARTASVSYRNVLAPEHLRRVLVEGSMVLADAPYLHVLLDEAPMSLLASLAEQLHREAGMQRELVWQNLRTLALQARSKRDIWQ